MIPQYVRERDKYPVPFIILRRGDPFIQVGEEAPPPIFPLVFFLTIPQN